jgi:tyrosine-protein phosphatase SIW14
VRFNKILASAYAAVLVAVLSLTIPSLVAGTYSNNEKVSNIRIKNFGRISDNYYRGGQPEGRDYTDLADLGINTVINLIGDDIDPSEEAMVENAGMKYYQIPMTTHEPPTSAKLEEFLRIVNDPASQPVYVHCVGGRHRTGVMTAIYRIMQDGWTADQAYDEMKQYNFGPSFLHPEFKSFVYDYYKRSIRVPAAPQQTVVAGKTAGQ